MDYQKWVDQNVELGRQNTGQMKISVKKHEIKKFDENLLNKIQIILNVNKYNNNQALWYMFFGRKLRTGFELKYDLNK